MKRENLLSMEFDFVVSLFSTLDKMASAAALKTSFTFHRVLAQHSMYALASMSCATVVACEQLSTLFNNVSIIDTQIKNLLLNTIFSYFDCCISISFLILCKERRGGGERI